MAPGRGSGVLPVAVSLRRSAERVCPTVPAPAPCPARAGRPGRPGPSVRARAPEPRCCRRIRQAGAISAHVSLVTAAQLSLVQLRSDPKQLRRVGRRELGPRDRRGLGQPRRLVGVALRPRVPRPASHAPAPEGGAQPLGVVSRGWPTTGPDSAAEADRRSDHPRDAVTRGPGSEGPSSRLIHRGQSAHRRWGSFTTTPQSSASSASPVRLTHSGR